MDDGSGDDGFLDHQAGRSDGREGAGGKLGTSDLLMLGFVLFCFTLVVNLLASLIVNRSRSGKGVEL